MTTKAIEQVDSHKTTQEAVISLKLTAPLVNTSGVTKKSHQPSHQAGS